MPVEGAGRDDADALSLKEDVDRRYCHRHRHCLNNQTNSTNNNFDYET